jgi:hypothetical protein
MSPKLCLIWRGFSAAVLLAGFYILGFGISGGLLYLSYRLSGVQNTYLYIVYVISMALGSILSSYVVPHPVRFRAPGPRLDPDDQPLLFEVVKRAAATAGKPVPAEIYLIEDLDNGIAYRGGFLGIGARPIMLIGFPLLHMLTVPQLEAMLVYWFVYLDATRPWIDEFLLETKDGVFRMLHTRLLPERSLKFNVVLFPIMGYRKLFYRAYVALNKMQRRTAVEAARLIVPHEELDAAIRVIERHGHAFAEYFREDISVNIRQGYHPPLMDGYRLYQQSSGETVEEPPHAPASSLLKGTHWLESWVLKAHSPSEDRPLKYIGWEEAGEYAVLGHWEWLCDLNYPAIQGLTLKSLPATVTNIDSFASRTWAQDETDDMRRWYAEEVLIAALGCALYRAGWKLDYAPGSWSLRRGEMGMTPRRIIQEMRQPGAEEAWNQMLEYQELDPTMFLALSNVEQVPLES